MQQSDKDPIPSGLNADARHSSPTHSRVPKRISVRLKNTRQVTKISRRPSVPKVNTSPAYLILWQRIKQLFQRECAKLWDLLYIFIHRSYRDLEIKIRTAPSSFLMTVSLVLSLCIAVLVVFLPSKQIPNSFTIPLVGKEIHEDPYVEIPFIPPSFPPLHKDTLAKNVRINNGCYVTSQALGMAGMDFTQMSSKFLNKDELSFSGLKTFFSLFPDSNINSVEKCQYISSAPSLIFKRFQVLRINWDKTPPQKTYFKKISSNYRFAIQSHALVWKSYGFSELAHDGYTCLGFLSSQLIIITKGNYPTCDLLGNLLSSMTMR